MNRKSVTSLGRFIASYWSGCWCCTVQSIYHHLKPKCIIKEISSNHKRDNSLLTFYYLNQTEAVNPKYFNHFTTKKVIWKCGSYSRAAIILYLIPSTPLLQPQNPQTFSLKDKDLAKTLKNIIPHRNVIFPWQLEVLQTNCPFHYQKPEQPFPVLQFSFHWQNVNVLVPKEVCT